jgi:hypothetical protein
VPNLLIDMFTTPDEWLGPVICLLSDGWAVSIGCFIC